MAIEFKKKAQKIFLGDKEVGWVYKDGKEVYRKSGLIPVRYVQVSSADFDSGGNYTGWERYIILPAGKTSGYKITNSRVKGVATNGDYLTGARNMFHNYKGLNIELDYLDTSNVTDMSYMFLDSQATTLDLSSFNTSNVTDMKSMFSGSEATTIDVSNFDTSNVTSMSYMFMNSQSTTLDLSSFDISNVTSMFSMFANSQATIGYARTWDEADIFNNTLNKPSTLTFVVEGEEPPVTTYTVTFVDHDDTLIKEELVEEGSSATAPTNPTREGYTFDGWDKAFDVITSDLTVKAIYNINTYTVTFTDDEDVVIGSPQTIEHGSSATAPTPPEKEGYTFDGWDVTFDNVTSNLTVKAIYIEDEEPEIPSYYVQVSSADFNASGNYTGTEEYIILPVDKTSGYKIINSNVKGVATSGDYLTDASNMFYGHNGLYLELDYLDTSNVTTMYRMFYNSKATTLDVSNFDTSNVNSMAQIFWGSQAASLDVSNFDTSNVTDMGYMFYNTQATTLDVSNFDTSNVTSMNSMFSNSKVTTLDLSSFDTSNVTNMNYMFSNSRATKGYARTQVDADNFNNSSNKPSTLTFVVKIPIEHYVQVSSADFDVSGNYIGTEEYIILPENKPSGYRIVNANVKGVATSGSYLTDASSMFYGHNGLYLELDYLDTSNVTTMYRMFYNSKATTLDLSNFDTSNVTTMHSMFWSSQAASLDVSNFDTSNVTDMGYMFYNSQTITLDLSSFDTSNVTNMGSMFYNSKATTGYARIQADADKFNNVSGKPSTLAFTSVFKTPLEHYVQVSSTDFSSTGDYTGTEEYIILPEDKPSGYRIRNANVKGVATSGDYLTDASNMFYGHNSLTLELDYLDTSNVTDMNNMFYDSKATILDVSNFDTSNVTNMSNMFRGSPATTLDLSNFDTSNVTTMHSMFYNSKATTIDVSNFDTSNVTTMVSMFQYVPALTLDLSSFDVSNANVSQMFWYAYATTGYARTSTDAYKLNKSWRKSTGLTFVVK